MRASIQFTQRFAILAIATLSMSGCTPKSQPMDQTGSNSQPDNGSSGPNELEVLELGELARKNLYLIARPARPTDYWRTITIPGVVQDRPGISDRGVTSPAVGVVTDIHAYPGDTVKPGQRLVTVRLFSEYLQATQTQLFKASQEEKLVRSQIARLDDAASSGAISGVRLIELRNDLQRQETLALAARQELLNRGLTAEQIAQVSVGNFVSNVEIVAPPEPSDAISHKANNSSITESANDTPSTMDYEVHALAVELGQTVQAGELVANLSNHRSLYVVGHAFKREATLLERAAQNKTPLQIEFAEDDAASWPSISQTFQIRHLANVVDIETRTFDFYVPLQNQSRTYQRDEDTFLVWRYRPGQRARIHVPVEQLTNVFVLPAEAVVHEGPNAFVYRQNGDLFNQIRVHVLHEDRLHVIIANDKSITPGTFIAQNAAASLRRVLKAQSASGEQPGLHVHADGSVHAAH